jgi:LuxR family quorum sensing-dependent transcriptional regulator
MNSHTFARTLEFVDRCNTPTGLNVLIEDFRALIADYGFDASACGAWDGLGHQRVHRFFFNDWPASWLQLYTEKDFVSVDPFVEEARRAMAPFLWSEVEHKRPLTPRGREVYETGREYGWREVIGIPIHGPVGYQGMVSLASMQDITLSATDRAGLDMVSRVIHEKCRKEVGFGLAPEDTPKLSPRELECMQWVAVGKTDWEVGQVLGISSSTAHFHIESAKKKLGISSRTEAVARLTLYGLL